MWAYWITIALQVITIGILLKGISMATENEKAIMKKIDDQTNLIGQKVQDVVNALSTPPTDDPDVIAWLTAHQTTLQGVATQLAAVGQAPAPVDPNAPPTAVP